MQQIMCRDIGLKWEKDTFWDLVSSSSSEVEWLDKSPGENPDISLLTAWPPPLQKVHIMYLIFTSLCALDQTQDTWFSAALKETVSSYFSLPGRLSYLSLTFGWRSWNFAATLWCRCLSLCNSLSKIATLSCNLLSSPLAARSAGFEDESTMSSSSINSSSFLPLRESGESPPCWKLHKPTIFSHTLSEIWRVLILLVLCISSYSYLVSLPFQNLFHSLQGIWTTDSDYANPTIRNNL